MIADLDSLLIALYVELTRSPSTRVTSSQLSNTPAPVDPEHTPIMITWQPRGNLFL